MNKILPLLNIIDSRNDEIQDEVIKRIDQGSTDQPQTKAIFLNLRLCVWIPDIDIKEKQAELKAWILPLGVREGDPLRLRKVFKLTTNKTEPQNWVKNLANQGPISRI